MSTGETTSDQLTIAKEVRIDLHLEHMGTKCLMYELLQRFDNVINQSTKSLLQHNNSNKLIEERNTIGKLSKELKEVEKTLSLFLRKRKQQERPGYWTRLAKRLNKVFFIFYVTGVTLFLVVMYLKWYR